MEKTEQRDPETGEGMTLLLSIECQKRRLIMWQRGSQMTSSLSGIYLMQCLTSKSRRMILRRCTDWEDGRKTRLAPCWWRSPTWNWKITSWPCSLKNLKQPIDKFRGIGMAHDLPPKEREEIKRLVKSAKDEHSANVGDDVENFKFVVVWKGQRRRVVKIRRRTTSLWPLPTNLLLSVMSLTVV